MADFPVQYKNPGPEVELKVRRGYPLLGASPDETGVNTSRYFYKTLVDVTLNSIKTTTMLTHHTSFVWNLQRTRHR